MPHVTLTALPDLRTLDSDELKALVIQQHALIIENHALVLEKNAALESQQDEIQRLKLFIAKLQRMQFGPSSERLAHHIDQLELGLEKWKRTWRQNRRHSLDSRLPHLNLHAGHCLPSCHEKPKRFRRNRVLAGLRRCAEAPG